MRIGARVDVTGHGLGILAVDNNDNTWNVELDDGDEGDFANTFITISADESKDALLHAAAAPLLSTGIRVVNHPAQPKPSGWTRFACFSDTHGLHDNIPSAACWPADVLLHAGDFTNTGEVDQIESLVRWLAAYPAEHRVVIAGNHDLTLDPKYYLIQEGWRRFHSAPLDCDRARAVLEEFDCIYLQDEQVEVRGYTIYGSPWQPAFCDWAFNLPRGTACWEKWSAIPEAVDVLMTHGPPYGRGDQTHAHRGHSGERVGCQDLRRAIEQRSVSVSVAGHVHEGYGVSHDGATLYVNASTCTHDYRPTNLPIVFDAPPPAELRAATTAAAASRRPHEVNRATTAEAQAALAGMV